MEASRSPIGLAKGQDGKAMLFDRVEEGHYNNGVWVFERVWNGDQTGDGLNFTGKPVVLKVRLGTYDT